MRFGVFVAMLGIAVSGCAGTPRFGDPSVQTEVTQLDALPPPTDNDLSQSTIGSGDKLRIDVFGVEDLSREVEVDAGGNVAVPLAGTVRAAGRSPADLSRAISEGLRAYVRNPQVAVNVIESVSQTFSVDGQVTQPGVYPIVGNMSLMRAVATAKGTSEFAKLDDVVVFRKVDGRSMAALYNLAAIRRGVYADPKVYTNDVIVVGESSARRLFKDALQIAPALVTPLVLLLQR